MATLADVARHAGVASSTVSYVLSGKRSVSDATRRRVERSIELLDYHPHAGARALASNRSNIIALVVPLRSDLYVPVMMEIAIAVTTTARRFGYDVLLLTNDEGPDGIRRVAVSARADAIILMDVSMDDDRLPMLREVGIDAVLIGVPAETAGLACVDLDFDAAGARCIDHLAGLGHREVAFLGEAPAVYQRRSGFAERALRGAADRACLPWCPPGPPAVRGQPRGRRRGDHPDPRGSPRHHGAHRAERGHHLAVAQRAAHGRADRARGHVGGRHLPGPGGRADLTASHLGGDPGRGDGPPQRGTARPAAQRRAGQRGRAAAARTDPPGQYRAGPAAR